jgi:hypothetical protein
VGFFYWRKELSLGVGAGVSVFLAVWQLRISAASSIWQGKGGEGGGFVYFLAAAAGNLLAHHSCCDDCERLLGITR